MRTSGSLCGRRHRQQDAGAEQRHNPQIRGGWCKPQAGRGQRDPYRQRDAPRQRRMPGRMASRRQPAAQPGHAPADGDAADDQQEQQPAGTRVPGVIDLAGESQQPGGAGHRDGHEHSAEPAPGDREDPSQHAVRAHGVAAHPHPCDDARDQRQGRDQPVHGRAVADGNRAADVEEHRRVGCPRGEVGRLQRGSDGDNVLAGRPHCFAGQPFGSIARRVVRVAVADRGEVQAGNVPCLEDREVGVVRQARVHLDRVRAAARMRRAARPRPHQPSHCLAPFRTARTCPRTRSIRD